VPKALGDFLVLRACRETGGCAVAVSDARIVAEIHAVATGDGLFLCPEGAATVAALPNLLDRRLIDGDERVMLFNTGAGLKYPEMVSATFPIIDPGDDL
jgi:threonine synthase